MIQIKQIPPPVNVKIILQYRGTNQALRVEPDSTRIGQAKMYAEKKFPNTVKEVLLLEIEVFTGRTILISLESKCVYWYSHFENPAERNLISDSGAKVLESEILTDSENIFFIGKFTTTHIISMADYRFEEYHFVAIFDRNPGLIDFIKKNRSSLEFDIKSREFLD
jgi:hypothetical protein